MFGHKVKMLVEIKKIRACLCGNNAERSQMEARELSFQEVAPSQVEEPHNSIWF